MPPVSERPFHPHRSSIFSYGGKVESAGPRIDSFISRHWAPHPDIQVLAETLGDFNDDLEEDSASRWDRQSVRESCFSVASSTLSTLSDEEFFDIESSEFQTLATATAKLQVYNIIPMRNVKRVNSPITTSNLENTQNDVCQIDRLNSLSKSASSWDGMIDESWLPRPPDAVIEKAGPVQSSSPDSRWKWGPSDYTTPANSAASIPEDGQDKSLDTAPSIPPLMSSPACDQSVRRRRDIREVVLPDYDQRSATYSTKLYHLPIWSMDIRTANSGTEALHDDEYHDGEYHESREMCSSSHDPKFSQVYTGTNTTTFRGDTPGHSCDTGFHSARPGLKYLVSQWWRRVSH